MGAERYGSWPPDCGWRIQTECETMCAGKRGENQMGNKDQGKEQKKNKPKLTAKEKKAKKKAKKEGK